VLARFGFNPCIALGSYREGVGHERLPVSFICGFLSKINANMFDAAEGFQTRFAPLVRRGTERQCLGQCSNGELLLVAQNRVERTEGIYLTRDEAKADVSDYFECQRSCGNAYVWERGLRKETRPNRTFGWSPLNVAGLWLTSVDVYVFGARPLC